MLKFVLFVIAIVTLGYLYLSNEQNDSSFENEIPTISSEKTGFEKYKADIYNEFEEFKSKN